MKFANGVAYNLAKIDWAVAFYLTWEFESRIASTDFSEQRRESDFNNLLGSICVRHKLHRRNLAYYRKTEWGKSGRAHYNALLARQGTKNVSPDLIVESAAQLWRPHGLAEIQPFDKNKHLQSVIYAAKQEFDAFHNPRVHPEYFSPALNTLLFRLKDSAPENSIASFAN
jgi:hypothetical protein